MIYIKKKSCSSSIQESLNQVRHSDAWRNCNDSDVIRMRNCFDSLNKDAIKMSLLEEQHGLCAYCMKKISKSKMTIEHWKPLSLGKEYALNYSNFAACCLGGKDSDGEKVLCCDAAKGSKSIAINPWDNSQMERIKYTTDGRLLIDSKNLELQHDIDYILKLNGDLDQNGHIKHDTSTRLVEGRREAYKKYKRYVNLLEKKYKKSNDKNDIVADKLIKRIKALESQDEYEEFIGVILYFMKRRVRNRKDKS